MFENTIIFCLSSFCFNGVLSKASRQGGWIDLWYCVAVCIGCFVFGFFALTTTLNAQAVGWGNGRSANSSIKK
jgi:hypothetical protein